MNRDVSWKVLCHACGARYPGLHPEGACACGEPLDVKHDLGLMHGRTRRDRLDARRGSARRLDRSGVWRFRELILPVDEAKVFTRPEGNTNLYASGPLGRFAGLEEAAWLKHEGENPTGSFKDRGMTVALTVARLLGSHGVACASTGNTAASMAAYAATAGLPAAVFVPAGGVAESKLAQAVAHGARVLEIDGDFDTAMQLVREVCEARGYYLVNSLNPFRVEGQKSIVFEMIQDMDWNPPDWIVLPGGNLGNTAAVTKALAELRELGWLQRLPRVAVVQAEGAAPFARYVRRHLAPPEGLVPASEDPGEIPGAPEPEARPQTLASAIRIGRPVSWRRAARGLRLTGGVVETVTDREILEAKLAVDAAGIGAEPASCAAVAGLRKLVGRGVVARDARAAVVLTGHLLKDPDTVLACHHRRLPDAPSRGVNPPRRCPPDRGAILRLLDEPR